MAKKNSNITIANVARLYYLKKMSQEEIADSIGLSRSQVSRLIQRAWDEGMIQIRITRPKEAAMESMTARLEKRFHLKSAVVIPSEGAPDFTKRSLLLEAGSLLEKYLLKRSINKRIVLGVYGKTLEGFPVHYKPLFHYPELITLPLTWDFSQAVNYRKANEIVQGIAAMMGGTCELFQSSMAETLRYYQRLAVCALVAMDDLECAASSFTEHAGWQEIPYTIGLALGRGKLTAILDALNSKIVNCLVTDEVTAENILQCSNGSNYSAADLALVK